MGDHKAFEGLYRTTVQELLRYGKRFSADSSIVEDAIQESFIQIWNNRKDLPEMDAPIRYLYRSVRNNLLKRITRKEQRYVQQDEHTPFDVSPAIDESWIEDEQNREQWKAVQDAIAKLPPRQKEVLYLKYQKGFSYEEIAEIMQINYQSIRNTVARAIQKIRSQVQIGLLFINLIWIE